MQHCQKQSCAAIKQNLEIPYRYSVHEEVSLSFAAEYMHWSPKYISPLSGSSSPAIILSKVVFPHPEGPKSVVNSLVSLQSATL